MSEILLPVSSKTIGEGCMEVIVFSDDTVVLLSAEEPRKKTDGPLKGDGSGIIVENPDGLPVWPAGFRERTFSRRLMMVAEADYLGATGEFFSEDRATQ